MTAVFLTLRASLRLLGLASILAPAAASAVDASIAPPAVVRYAIGGAGGWDFLTFDPVRNRLFITRGDRVQVWDAGSHAVTAEIAGTPGVHGVTLAQDLGRGFTSNGRANTVSVFGLSDLRIQATIAVPGENPDAILYVPSVKRVYAFNGKSHNVTVIDAVTLAVVTTVALGGKPEVAVADGAGHVFVNIEDTGEIVVLDLASNRVEARWPLKPCEEPSGLAIDVGRQRLFAVCANRKMVVLDAGSGRVLAELPIGAEPDGAEFDPASGLAFSSNGDGSLTLVREVDAQHFAVVATVATQARARTMALDPVSHKLYLVTASFGPAPLPTAAQPRPRPPMLGDTFTLLVVDPG